MIPMVVGKGPLGGNKSVSAESQKEIAGTIARRGWRGQGRELEGEI